MYGSVKADVIQFGSSGQVHISTLGLDDRGQLTHHGRSLVANDIRTRFKGGGVHDAGGGDVEGHHVESQ